MANEVQVVSRSILWARLVYKPFWRMRWWWNRMVLVYRLTRTMWCAKEIEDELKAATQAISDAYFAGDREMEEQARAYCDGIDFCLKRKWLK